MDCDGKLKAHGGWTGRFLLLVNCCKFNILPGPNLLWLRMIQWYMKNNLQSKCHLPIEQRLKLLYWRVNLTVSASPASHHHGSMCGNVVWKLKKLACLFLSVCCRNLTWFHRWTLLVSLCSSSSNWISDDCYRTMWWGCCVVIPQLNCSTMPADEKFLLFFFGSCFNIQISVP